MERRITFAPREYYHTYNRGIEKKNIFRQKNDRDRMQMLLYLSNSTKSVKVSNLFIGVKTSVAIRKKIYNLNRGETLVDIGAYCFMPNHFHILAHEKIENGISKFMHKMTTAYSMFFNTKYERSGSLFLKPFRAQHADTDNYLNYLSSYIHLNPVKLIESKWKEKGIKDIERVKEYLKSYWHSSYVDYLGIERIEKNILNREAFPEYFQGVIGFEQEIDGWLTYSEGLE